MFLFYIRDAMQHKMSATAKEREMSGESFLDSIKSNRTRMRSASEMWNTHKIYFYATFLMTFVAFCTWWGNEIWQGSPRSNIFSPTQPHIVCRRLDVGVRKETRAN